MNTTDLDLRLCTCRGDSARNGEGSSRGRTAVQKTGSSSRSPSGSTTPPRDDPEFTSLEPIRSHEIPVTEGILAQAMKPITQFKRVKKTRPKQDRCEACEAHPRQTRARAATVEGEGGDISFAPSTESTMIGETDECEKAGSKEEVYVEEEWTYPDGGWRAWSVVFACWVFAASQLSWGMCWGALVPELKEKHYPDVPLSTLNLISGLANLFVNSFAFVSGRLGDKFGYRPIIAIGSVGYVVFLIAHGLSVDSLPGLFITNICVGSSMALAFPLICALPAQYFLKKRGLATGIAVSGTGFGGAIGSIIIRGILPFLGYRKTLLIYAGINAVTTSCAFLLIRVREPPLRPGEKRVAKAWIPKDRFRDPAFYSLALCVFVGIWGYLVPYVFLVTYTQYRIPDIGVGIKPAVPLILANTAGGFGRIIAGLLADRFGPVNMLFASFFIGGFLQLVYWPFATTYGSIIGFAILYGLSGAWMVSLLPVASAQLFGMKGLATITGFMILLNAPGQAAGGTVAGLVLTASGGHYAPVAYFGGAMMVGGSICLLYARFSREKRIFARF